MNSYIYQFTEENGCIIIELSELDISNFSLCLIGRVNKS